MPLTRPPPISSQDSFYLSSSSSSFHLLTSLKILKASNPNEKNQVFDFVVVAKGFSSKSQNFLTEIRCSRLNFPKGLRFNLIRFQFGVRQWLPAIFFHSNSTQHGRRLKIPLKAVQISF